MYTLHAHDAEAAQSRLAEASFFVHLVFWYFVGGVINHTHGNDDQEVRHCYAEE